MTKQRYIPRQRDRIEEIMGDRLSAIKLGDSCTIEVCGPVHVPALDNQGRQAMALGWNITLWLGHNKLIGQDPIYVSVPLGAVMIDEATLITVTDKLLDEARKIRAKAENPGQVASLEEMIQAAGGSKNGNGPAG